MAQENPMYYNPMDELDEDLNINFQKIWKAFLYRRKLLTKVFFSVLAFFILLTFILPKKYEVSADLYVNKANNSNMVEINPYVLNDATGSIVPTGADKAINNEIELMKSELVLDKVIRDNDIKYQSGKKKGEYLTAEAFYGRGKRLRIENVKNTNVITIQYKAKKPELAYGVVSSLITNYIELHKELNTEKSKSDTKLLETEYEKIKQNLDKKLSQSTGIPAQSMSGISNISAMSAFSTSAARALGSLKSQYLAGEKSQIAITEESQKLTQLATKLEWAKMVEQMSDSSKVLVIKEPKQLRPFEKSSPKLLIHIMLGCLFGALASLVTLIFVEQGSDKVTYSMLTNNIFFDGIKETGDIETELYSLNPKKVLILSFVQLPNVIVSPLQSLPNVYMAYYNGTKDFIDKINVAENIVLVSKIDNTEAKSYKMVRKVAKNQDKQVIYDILL